MRIGLYFFRLCIFTALVSYACLAHGENQQIRLDDLIEEALGNNPEILAAKKNWEVLVEKVPQASALEDPMLGFGIVNLPTNFSFTDEDMTMKELSISQKLPFPGKRSLMRQMAENEAHAASSEIEDTANRILREVKTVYYDISHVYRAREVTQRNKQILETLAKTAETRYATGEGIEHDLLKAHVEISRMVDELIMLDQKKEALEVRLCSLLNRPQGMAVGEPEELIFRRVSLNLAELQKTALDTNPTLQAVKRMIEAKENAHRFAKMDYYPDFTVRFAYGQRDDSADMERKDMLTGMVEVNLPIFYKSKQSRKVAETSAEIQTLEARYETMKNEIFYMIANMLSMLQRTERQLELYKTGIIPQAGFQVRTALSAYVVNKTDFMTLLDSQMTLYRYELEYHGALTEYEKNLAELELAVGKHLPRGEGK